MKLVFIFLLLSSNLMWAGQTYAQITSLNLDLKNVPLEEVFDAIRKQSEFEFFYNNDQVNTSTKVSVKAKNADIKTVLDQVLPNIYEYKINDRYILVNKRKEDVPVLSTQPQQTKKTIRGTVTDKDGEAIIGANVVVKGTSNGTVTDTEGQFSVSMENDSLLHISYIGYLAQDINTQNKTILKIILQEEPQTLEEMVVVGYGVQKKVTLTGAVSAISDNELTSTKSQNVQNMLTGKVSGVRIVQKTSEPGQFSNNFDIRGYGAPLVIVDGVPRESFTRMDPNEIESISVLKDASAAVFGVKAANGVILITTKNGKKGKPTLSYEFYYGSQIPSGLPKSLDAVNWMTLMNEKAMHNVNGGTKPYSEELMNEYRSGAKKSTYWHDEVMQKTAPQQSHSLSITGGRDDYDYFMNAGYMYQEGFWKTKDLNYNRYNVRSNINMKVTEHLKASLNLSGIYDITNQPNTSATYLVFKYLWALSPVVPYYANNTASYFNKTQDGMHPGVITDSDLSGYQRNENRIFQGSIALTYDFPWIKGLAAKGLYSYDYYSTTSKSYRKSYNIYEYDESTSLYKSNTMNSPSQVRRSFLEKPNTLLQASLDYKKSFFQNHNINALLLYEETVKKADNFYALRELNLALDQLFAGNTTNQEGSMDIGNLFEYNTKSVVGRINYDYMSKYMAEFSFRYDGSSRFPQSKQWGFFPSVFLGWRISEENFIKKNESLSFLTNLKLRGSYGEVGDDNSSSYQFISGYNYPATGGNSQSLAAGYVFDDTFINSVGFRVMPNPNITWYEAKMYNVGIDGDVLNGIFGFSLDLFKRKRTNLLATKVQSIPSTLGASLPQENINSDQNAGFEIDLKHRYKLGDFGYNISGNFSFTRTKWINFDRANSGNSYENWKNNPNNRYNNIWWGYSDAGQYQSFNDILNSPTFTGRGTLPGDYAYEDWNGDGYIDGWDSHPIATTNIPQIYYGITLGADYKGFDINLLFQGTAMVDVAYTEALREPLTWGGNGLEQFMDRWHPADPNENPYNPNIVWIPGKYGYTGSSPDVNSKYNVQDASYLRLKSIELGYNLPNNLLSKVGVKNTRLYINGYNLLTFTKIKYVDPEHPSDNFGYVYPLNKTINLGLNITF